MSKNVMQDVIPPDRRSIRNITLPHKKSRPLIKGEDDTPDPKPSREVSSPPRRKSTGGGSKKTLFTGITIVLILLGIGTLMTFFSKSVLTITPKISAVTVDTEIIASTDGSTPITYQMFELSLDLTKSVLATDERYVERQAQGTITIFNNFDDTDQRLITNTRFETPDGKIYRIRESVVVPGKVGETPGSIDVRVYADEPGEAYNVQTAEFTIPGFAGDPRFNAFSARTKTPILGGFIGNEKVVGDGVRTTTITELDTTLRANLLSTIRNEVPESMIILDDLAVFSFADMPPKTSGDMVVLGRSGTLRIPVFGNQALAQHIARTVGADDSLPIQIHSLDTLETVYTENSNPEQISFTISGNTLLVAIIDTDEIVSAIAGKKKSELSNILANFESVASAEATITPPWIRTFPQDAEKIKLNIQMD